MMAYFNGQVVGEPVLRFQPLDYSSVTQPSDALFTFLMYL